MLDTSSIGPEALILSDPNNLNLHLHHEDAEVFPATAFPKKVRYSVRLPSVNHEYDYSPGEFLQSWIITDRREQLGEVSQ